MGDFAFGGLHYTNDVSVTALAGSVLGGDVNSDLGSIRVVGQSGQLGTLSAAGGRVEATRFGGWRSSAAPRPDHGVGRACACRAGSVAENSSVAQFVAGAGGGCGAGGDRAVGDQVQRIVVVSRRAFFGAAQDQADGRKLTIALLAGAMVGSRKPPRTSTPLPVERT